MVLVPSLASPTLSDPVVSPRRARLDALTSCRFLAAALVVLHHNKDSAAWHAAPMWFLRFIRNGYSAVSFFFLLSGFVLVYAYVSPDTGLTGTRRAFWTARVARIYPIYLIALILAIPQFVEERFHPDAPWAISFLTPLVTAPILLQAWIPPAALSWNGPGWSLSVEACFYGLFPFLAAWLTQFRSRSLLMWSGVALLAIQIPLYFMFPLPDYGAAEIPNTRNLHFFMAYFPLVHLATFVFGMALGIFFLHAPNRMKSTTASVVFISASAIVLGLFAYHGVVSPIVFSGVCMVPLFGLVVFSLACSEGFPHRALSHPWLVRLGDASYTMYILHIPLAWWMHAARQRIAPQLDDLVFLVVYFVALTVVSVAIYLSLEKPMRTAITRLFAKEHTIRRPILGTVLEERMRL